MGVIVQFFVVLLLFPDLLRRMFYEVNVEIHRSEFYFYFSDNLCKNGFQEAEIGIGATPL